MICSRTAVVSICWLFHVGNWWHRSYVVVLIVEPVPVSVALLVAASLMMAAHHGRGVCVGHCCPLVEACCLDSWAEIAHRPYMHGLG
jgi:hypothetical protein